MTNSQLFIPEKIRVGYQEREDTFTKKLAYIIYYDAKGKIRKETSFEDWRDKKIKVEEYENKPHGGFSLNKGVKRYGHWGSGRSMVRVYDDRGMEFEITVDNLMFILMGDDCTRRELSGTYVYAWSGVELILLPTNSEEYAQSTQYTSLQSGKVSAKNLIPGAVYRTKKQVDLIYLGRFDWHVYDYNYSEQLGKTKAVKKHIFQKIKDKKDLSYNEDIYYATAEMTALASLVNDQPVENYAKLLQDFSKSSRASKIKSLFTKPTDLKLDEEKASQHYSYDQPLSYKDLGNGSYEAYQIQADSSYADRVRKFIGWIPIKQSVTSFLKDGELKIVHSNDRSHYYGYNDSRATKRQTTEQIKNQEWVDLWVELESGSKMKIETYCSNNSKNNY